MFSLHFRNFCSLSLLCVAPSVLACSKSAQLGPVAPSQDGQPPTEIVHEECDIDAAGAIKTDVNNDGRADIVQVMQGSREVCRVLDLNFDGRVDNYLYFDEAGNLRRRESDFDRDGVIDEIGLYQNGRIVQKHRETNLDGKLDTWDTYVNERLTERRRDTNADGKVDQWWTFPDPSRPDCPVIAVDETGNGKPDTRNDPCKERDAEMTAAGAGSPTPKPPEPPAQDDQDAGADAEKGGS